jgi:hypothetical protein
MTNIITHDQHTKMVNKQRETQNVIKTELDRLNTKKSNMDADEYNANRIILLNESYREKQRLYLVLMATLLITFGLSLILVFFQERLGYSSIFIDTLIVIILVSGFISVYYQYENIQSRDKIDFSKLSNTMLLHPSEFEKDDYGKAKASGDISAMSASICKGSVCCGPGLTYNTNAHICE